MKNTICPLKLVMEIVGGKWKCRILCLLEDGEPKRYGQIRERIPDITNTMLAQSLKELERFGVVNRIQYDEMPVRVEYQLSEYGKTLLPITGEMCRWGRQYIDTHGNEYVSLCAECKSKGNASEKKKGVR